MLKSPLWFDVRTCCEPLSISITLTCMFRPYNLTISLDPVAPHAFVEGDSSEHHLHERFIMQRQPTASSSDETGPNSSKRTVVEMRETSRSNAKNRSACLLSWTTVVQKHASGTLDREKALDSEMPRTSANKRAATQSQAMSETE